VTRAGRRRVVPTAGVHLETSAPRLPALERSSFVASAIREADRVYYTAYRVT